jgi:hypothetical protein
MASAELLLKTLDANQKEVQNILPPTQAGSATTTDNATTPTSDTAAGAPGTSLLASPADHSHPAASGTLNKVGLDYAGAGYSVGIGEEILREWLVNFDDATATQIKVFLSGIVKVSAAGTATYNVRVGATAPGATTGSTVHATFTSTSTTEEMKEILGSAFANPTGQKLVQVTADNDTAAVKSYIRGIQVTIG